MIKELREEDFIVSKTDLKGRITYCNRIFMDMCEYSESELIGKPHNIIRHPDMPKAVFKYLWSELPQKREVFAYVVNKTKHNNDYWVFANITATTNESGNIIDYYSVRRRPNPKALEAIKPIYAKMLGVEKKEGVDASMRVLSELLAEKGATLNELNVYLQNQ